MIEWETRIVETDTSELFAILALAREVLEEGHPTTTRIYKLAKHIDETLGPILDNYPLE